jgi:hypothetical protein
VLICHLITGTGKLSTNPKPSGNKKYRVPYTKTLGEESTPLRYFSSSSFLFRPQNSFTASAPGTSFSQT